MFMRVGAVAAFMSRLAIVVICVSAVVTVPSLPPGPTAYFQLFMFVLRV
jgi:hypothetical protein